MKECLIWVFYYDYKSTRGDKAMKKKLSGKQE